MLKLVYGDAAVTMKTVYKWFERFHNGCELVEDEERSGRPSTSKTQENFERVSEMIQSNKQLNIWEISEDMNIYYGSVQNILTGDLNMRRVSAKFVPRFFTVKQKQQRLSISLEWRDLGASVSSFLGNDPETSVQSSQWKSPSSPCARKVRQSRPNIKVIVIVFLNFMGLCELSLYPGTLR